MIKPRPVVNPATIEMAIIMANIWRREIRSRRTMIRRPTIQIRSFMRIAVRAASTKGAAASAPAHVPSGLRSGPRDLYLMRAPQRLVAA